MFIHRNTFTEIKLLTENLKCTLVLRTICSQFIHLSVIGLTAVKIICVRVPGMHMP